jgi:hypothetical protein
MKKIFVLLPLALGLAACADADMTADANSCKRVVSAQDKQMIFAHSIVADGRILSGRPISDGGELVPDGTRAYACARQEDRKNSLRTHDPQNVGQAMPIPSVTESTRLHARIS